MDLLDRLSTRIAVGDGCWEWTAARDRDGYGILTGAGTSSTKAHRIVYELMVGPIPVGLQIHHRCENRGCVRPDHLKPVTPRENLFASATVPAVNAAKTHCPQGHSYAEHGGVRRGRANRYCRVCMREATRRRRARRKGATNG